MISGNDDHVVLILAKRTRKNLKYIYEKKCEGAPVNEFTQLLNSMLGMVISLREDGLIGDDVSWEDAQGAGILRGRERLKDITGKQATRESPNLRQINSFSQLVFKLRNAFAHRNFQLESVGGQEIEGITVWNIPPGQDRNQRNRTWEAHLSEEELKDAAYAIVAYVEEKYR